MPPNWNQPQPAPRAVWTLVHANFPQTRFMGIYSRRNVAGTNTPSAHAEGRALDIGLEVARPQENVLGDQLFDLLIRNSAELGLDHVIWNRQIWSTARGGPRPYTGVSPHTDHIHLAFTRDGSQRTTFPRTTLAVAILRTGYDDLNRAYRSMA